MTAVGVFPLLMLIVQWFGGIFLGLVLGALFYFWVSAAPGEVVPAPPIQKQSLPLPVVPKAPAAPAEGMV